MNRKQIETYEMLNRVAGFARQNVTLFPRKSAAAEILKELEANVATMNTEAHALVSSETALRSSTSASHAARVKLRTALNRSSQLAGALDVKLFQAPSVWTERSLINTAHAVAVDAEPIKEELAQHGLPVENIAAAVETLERVREDRTKARTSKTVAEKNWSVAFTAALRAAKRFDLLVATTFENEPGVLGAYAVARVVRHSASTHKPAPEVAASSEETTTAA